MNKNHAVTVAVLTLSAGCIAVQIRNNRKAARKAKNFKAACDAAAHVALLDMFGADSEVIEKAIIDTDICIMEFEQFS